MKARPVGSRTACEQRWRPPVSGSTPTASGRRRGGSTRGIPGTNQTLCGLSIHPARGCARFSHVDWLDVQPLTGRDADEVTDVCRRCAAGMGQRRDDRGWSRTNPRP